MNEKKGKLKIRSTPSIVCIIISIIDVFVFGVLLPSVDCVIYASSSSSSNCVSVLAQCRFFLFCFSVSIIIIWSLNDLKLLGTNF